MKAGENKVTDLSYLREISGGDEGFIAEMVSMFIKQCPEELANIHSAIIAKDHLALRNAAHKMKSTVSMLGIKRATDLLIEMQDGAHQQKAMEVFEPMFLEVKKLCSQAIEELS